jgi:hypothetical protein
MSISYDIYREVFTKCPTSNFYSKSKYGVIF